MPADDRVASTLAEIRERAANADQAYRFGGNFSEAAARSQADVPRLLKAAEAVLKRHRKSMSASLGEHRGRHYCAACTSAVDDFVDYVDWPCEEYRAITTALTGETPGG